MRILHSKFILLFFSFFWNLNTFAENSFTFPKSVTGFVNLNGENSLVFLSRDGLMSWVNTVPNLQIVNQTQYLVTSDLCFPDRQDPSRMEGAENGMLFVYPFFVGLGWYCKINEATKTISLVGQFDVPENAYSLVFANEDNSSLSFLINSKPLKGTGFLHLVSIVKKTSQAELRLFARNVPGYSGAMLFDQGDIWISTWPSKIYKIGKQNLASSLQAKKEEDFLKLAQPTLNNGLEMSLFMLKNNLSLLYFNYQYQSYTVNFAHQTLNYVALPCMPISGYGNDWVILCNEKTLQVWPFS